MQSGLGFNRYGKGDVRILRVIKDSPRHEVHELKALILLEGAFDEAWTKGDNRSIVPTETQKNTLYVLAKKYAVDPLEEWTINVAKDFMERYSHIAAVNLEVDEQPWERMQVNGVEHNHAFRKGASGVRFVSMRLSRKGELKMTSGVKELQVMKTTQSGFAGFIRDEYTTLPETTDRIFSTKIRTSWTYTNAGNGWKGLPANSSVSYNQLYENIFKIIIETFAGDPKTGVYSPSVQQTIYDTGMKVLNKYGVIDSVSFVLPNIHYYYVDFKQFKTQLTNKNEVYFTFDGAHGFIEGTVERKGPNQAAKL